MTCFQAAAPFTLWIQGSCSWHMSFPWDTSLNYLRDSSTASDHTQLKVFLLTACFQLFPCCGGSERKTGAGLWRARCGVQTPRAQSVPCLKARGGWDRLPAVWLGIIHNSRVKVGLLRAQLSVSLELRLSLSLLHSLTQTPTKQGGRCHTSSIPSVLLEAAGKVSGKWR